MKNFTESAHCVDKYGSPHYTHCKSCRGDSKWRAAVNAPEVCPYGVTLDSIPSKNSPPKTIKNTKGIPLELESFFDLGNPCDIEGCGPLREAYTKELSDLGDNCPNCQLYELRGRYIRKLIDLINTTKNARTPTTP